jgi:hypothetical protein
MLTTIALLITLAAPDAGPAPISPEGLQEANLELDAIAVMAHAPQRQSILSAILCDAQARARDIRLTIESGQLSRSLVRAEQSAARDEAGARRELARNQDLQLTCTEWSVSRLVTCLDAAAPFWCATDQHLAAPLLAAENLMRSWRSRPSAPVANAQTQDGGAQP